MVTDQEPRYRFRDSNGNITGTVFERGGELVVQEGTSGNENELVLQPDGTVEAKRLSGGYLYAGAFSGSDPDARLDNALSSASDGDVIALENGNYSDSRSITTRVSLIGSAHRKGTGILGDITVQVGSVHLRNIELDADVTVTSGNDFVIISNSVFSSSKTIEVSGGRGIITNIISGGGGITLTTGSERCVVDNCSDVSVTDNGTNNLVGDVI